MDFEAVEAVLEETGRLVAGRAGEAAPDADDSIVTAPSGNVVVDWSRLDSLREYDTAEGGVVKGVIASFMEQAPSRLDEIRRCIDERNAEGLRESAHSLKGAASNVGAVGVAEVCRELEQAGRSKSFDNVEGLARDLGVRIEESCVELDLGSPVDRP